MRIEQLDYLLAVTRHGSLRRASESMHVSQPALSESIRSLERELGVSLLERHRTGARISQQGRELVPLMTEILDAVTRLRTSARGQAVGARVLRVGTVNAGTSTILVPGIQKFNASHPDTAVEVVNVLQSDIYQGLLDGTMDIGLVNVLDGDDVPRDLKSVQVIRGRPVVCCRSDDPLAALDEVDVDSLRARPFVAMRKGYLMHRFMTRLFGHELPVGTCFTDGAENGKSLVAAGVGATVLPDYSVVGDPLEAVGVLVVRPLAGVRTSVTMLMVHRRTDRVPVLIDEFTRVLLAHASSLRTARSRPSTRAS